MADSQPFKHKGILGSEISSYMVCKRQAWLFHHRVGMEHTSESVMIGRVIHEMEDARKKEVKVGEVVIDRITEKYVVEVKKTDSHPESARWQLLYYLYTLKQKGIEKKGMIEFKKAKGNKRMYVELTKELEIELEKLLAEIESYFDELVPKKYEKIKECRGCSYFNYCHL